MACAITSGYAIGCRDSIGGASAYWIMEQSNLSSVAEASGVVTGLTKATGKRYWKFNIPRATGSSTDTGTGSVENGSLFFTHEVKFPLNRRDADVRNTLIVLAKNNGLSIVEKDANGSYWLYGRENGLDLLASVGGSGTAPGDRNGWDLTFTGTEKEPALLLSTGVAEALETPGA